MRISFYIILITFSFMNILSAEENNYYLILKNNKVMLSHFAGSVRGRGSKGESVE